MRRVIFAAALACAAIASPCQAQDKTVRILVGFPPGGTTDLLGRRRPGAHAGHAA